jgi:superoxide dismutase, Fe-Mn family
MTPAPNPAAPNYAPNQPIGELANAIDQTFGSFGEFKTKFTEAGMKRFGSGWVWLVWTRRKKLDIRTTPNQDAPLLVNEIPILGNDLWEHAYYLKYQNRRAEYLDAWWQVINWPIANDRYRQQAIG